MKTTFDVNKIRKDFPLIDGQPLAYLDNSATSQKPVQVLAAVEQFYREQNANPFRGLYELSNIATNAYEEARSLCAEFIGAADSCEVIFTRNASESLNLLAYSLGRGLTAEDEIISTVAEHHSNMLPWQHTARAIGATVRYLHPDREGNFSLEEFKSLLSSKTKIVAMTQMSNVFGRAIDLKPFIDAAHESGAVFVADASQSIAHMPVNVQELDVDFLAFSGHKMLAPMGIGVLYGKTKLLEKMPPFLTGGEMIEYVTLEDTTYAPLPHKFEAGTVNAGGAVGLGAAIRYLNAMDRAAALAHEDALTARAIDGLMQIPHVNIVGAKDAADHHGIVTFTIDDVHPHDVAAILADANIAVRAGHHCTQPLHQYMEIPSTTRASLMFYNTFEEIDRFADAVSRIRGLMGYND